jgi:hypothetical protein
MGLGGPWCGAKRQSMGSNGKGDKPRPLGVPRAEYERRWDETFRMPDAREDIRGRKVNGTPEHDEQDKIPEIDSYED